MWWGSLTTPLTLESCSSWVLGKTQALLELLTMLCRAPHTSGVQTAYREGTSKCTITGFQVNHMSKTKSVSIWCFCLKNLVLWNNFLVSSIMTSTSTFKAKIYQILLGKYWHFGTDHSFKSLETPFVSENLLVILMKSLWYVARLNWTKKSLQCLFFIHLDLIQQS